MLQPHTHIYIYIYIYMCVCVCVCVCGDFRSRDRTVYDAVLRPLACWDCVFEFRLGHECLSLVIVVCC